MRGEPEYLPEADRAAGCAHPRETYDLIGHKDAEIRFLKAISSGRMHHAWLITGPSGSGKATLAYRMIRHILGGKSLLENSLDIPASDPVAQRLEALGHGDFFLLRRPYDEKTKKFKTEIPVDATRNLRDFFTRKSSEGGWRCALIDTADELNRNAENGVLKTLEEPPDKTFIILLSSKPGRLLPTIRSRCLHLPLRAVPDAEILPWLRNQSENNGADPALLEAAVKLSRGAPGRAVSLLQNTETVLAPLTRYLASLDRGNTELDHQLAGLFAPATAQESRMLFWEALQDVLQAQTRFCATGTWQGAFKPLPVNCESSGRIEEATKAGHEPSLPVWGQAPKLGVE